jgi:hypothetical protein
MRYLVILGMATFVLACSIDKNERDKQTKNELYAVVNEIVKSEFSDISVITIETRNVYKEYRSKYIDSIPEPPPPGFIYFSHEKLEDLKHKGLIDSLDVNYIYDHIDSAKTYHLDSSKIIKPLISEQQKLLLFKTDFKAGYKYLKDKFGSSCFMNVSCPLFNKDFTTVIIYVEYCCGPLNGQGSIIILHKKDNKWIISDKLGTWIS